MRYPILGASEGVGEEIRPAHTGYHGRSKAVRKGSDILTTKPEQTSSETLSGTPLSAHRAQMRRGAEKSAASPPIRFLIRFPLNIRDG
eukprot:3891012-Pyramimonas_sp.AAC.1